MFVAGLCLKTEFVVDVYKNPPEFVCDVYEYPPEFVGDVYENPQSLLVMFIKIHPP